MIDGRMLLLVMDEVAAAVGQSRTHWSSGPVEVMAVFRSRLRAKGLGQRVETGDDAPIASSIAEAVKAGGCAAHFVASSRPAIMLMMMAARPRRASRDVSAHR